MTAGQRIARAKGGGRPSRASGREADPLSFWPTPMECTVALLRFLAVHEPEALNEARHSGVWCPAAGDGAMGRVIEAMGLTVTAHDIAERGYGRGGIDFLDPASPAPRCRVLIENPPFGDMGRDAVGFIERIELLRRLHLAALILPGGFWFAGGRKALFDRFRPSWILHMAWRPDFTGGGSGTMQLDWVVWTVWSRASRSAGEARVRMLEKPDLAGGLW